MPGAVILDALNVLIQHQREKRKPGHGNTTIALDGYPHLDIGKLTGGIERILIMFRLVHQLVHVKVEHQLVVTQKLFLYLVRGKNGKLVPLFSALPAFNKLLERFLKATDDGNVHPVAYHGGINPHQGQCKRLHKQVFLAEHYFRTLLFLFCS